MISALNAAEKYKKEGNTFYGKQEYESAIKSYEIAIKYNPDFKEAFFNLGMCYKNLGQIEKALNFFDQAIALDKKYEKAINQRKTLSEKPDSNEAGNAIFGK